QAKSGPPASFADAGAARRVPAAGSDAHFLLAFLGRAVTMGENSRRPRARERLDEGGERSSGGPHTSEKEERMGFTPVTKAAGTAGNAEGSTPLNAFDNALLAAGIGNINLVRISSILPPGVDLRSEER